MIAVAKALGEHHYLGASFGQPSRGEVSKENKPQDVHQIK